MMTRALTFVIALGALGALGLACVVASGCSVRASDQGKSGKSFTFRLLGEPETLDWNRAHTPIETYILMNLMEGLVGFDDKLKPIPALAESWKITDGGKTYTFKLHPGVKWSDGVALTAKDFVYSWKRLLSPLTAAPYAYFLFDVVGAQEFQKGKLKDFSQVGVHALDDHTLQVKLLRPVAYWIDIPTFWVTFPLREDIVSQFGSRWDVPGRMVTLGPFTLASHDLETRIVLKANPNYYGSRGNVDEAVGLIVKDDSTAVSLYESGRLDFMTDIPSLDLQRLSGKPDLKTFPYLKTGYLAFVTNKFPLSNVKVRRAIGMAIDKSKFADLLHGGQTPASSFVPPPLLGYSKKAGLPFDVVAAKKALKESGFDTIRSGPVELILANWDKPLTLGQYVQAQLKKNLNINVSLLPFDHKTFRAMLELRNYPVFLNSWSADYPDPDNFASVFLSDSGNNRAAWKNPRYDQLVLEGRSSQNPQMREKKYSEAQKILLEEDAVVVPLFYEPNMALIKARVKGLDLNPLNYLLLKKVTLE